MGIKQLFLVCSAVLLVVLLGWTAMHWQDLILSWQLRQLTTAILLDDDQIIIEDPYEPFEKAGVDGLKALSRLLLHHDDSVWIDVALYFSYADSDGVREIVRDRGELAYFRYLLVLDERFTTPWYGNLAQSVHSDRQSEWNSRWASVPSEAKIRSCERLLEHSTESGFPYVATTALVAFLMRSPEHALEPRVRAVLHRYVTDGEELELRIKIASALLIAANPELLERSISVPTLRSWNKYVGIEERTGDVAEQRVQNGRSLVADHAPFEEPATLSALLYVEHPSILRIVQILLERDGGAQLIQRALADAQLQLGILRPRWTPFEDAVTRYLFSDAYGQSVAIRCLADLGTDSARDRLARYLARPQPGKREWLAKAALYELGDATYEKQVHERTHHGFTAIQQGLVDPELPYLLLACLRNGNHVILRSALAVLDGLDTDHPVFMDLCWAVAFSIQPPHDIATPWIGAKDLVFVPEVRRFRRR